MRSAKSAGRLVGVLLFAQLIGLSLPFILLLPATAPGFLDNAHQLALQVKVAVLLLFVNGALTIGIAIVAYPTFRASAQSLALCFVALSIVWCSMQAVDNAHILSMLSLSQQYAEAGTSNDEIFRTLGAAMRATRRWAHYTELLIIDVWFFLFYFALFRLSLIPRALAAFGLVMVLVHSGAITLPTFVGYSSVQPLGFSLALSHLAVAGCLVVKGFEERHDAARS
jgi:hypothetical protein